MNIPSASHKKTNDKVFELLSSLISKKSKIVDLGAGRGHLSRRVHDFLTTKKFNFEKIYLLQTLIKNYSKLMK